MVKELPEELPEEWLVGRHCRLTIGGVGPRVFEIKQIRRPFRYEFLCEVLIEIPEWGSGWWFIYEHELVSPLEELAACLIP